MKKFLYLIAAAAFALVACQEPEAPNPNYDPETGEVTTQLVLSVSTGSPSTRMSAENVQKAENFNGIDSSRLIAFHVQTYTNDTLVSYTKNTADQYIKTYNIGMLYPENAINNVGNANKTTQSQRILTMNIPTGVNAFLFYGKAFNTNNLIPTTPAQAALTHQARKNKGCTFFQINDADPSKTRFAVANRIGNASRITLYDRTAQLMIYVINDIINTEVGEVNNYSTTVQANGQPFPVSATHLDPVSWKDLGHQYEYNIGSKTGNHAYLDSLLDHPSLAYRELSLLEETIGKCWSVFTRVEDGTKRIDYRAGSSSAIAYQISNMYSMIHTVAQTPPGNTAAEVNALRLAKAIEVKVKRYFDTSLWTYKDIGTGANETEILYYVPESERNNYSGVTSLNNYPGSFNIPDGAAQLSFVHRNGSIGGKTDVFYYKHPNSPLVDPNHGLFDPSKYMYPAEICYFVNSGIYVTEDEFSNDASFYPNGVDNWAAYGNWPKTRWLKNGAVQSNTHSVAIRDNIHYGVAMMETNVTAATTLYDNKVFHNPGETANNEISRSDLLLKGILIGDVNPIYDWQFLPVKNDGTESSPMSGKTYGFFDGVIYDDVIESNTIPTTKPTYTLVYDNYHPEAQDSVYVALEFINNGSKSFWGRDELIPAGGTFYLLACLHKAEKSAAHAGGHNAGSIKWPSEYYQIPPIYLANDQIPSGKSIGQSKEIERVFIQDFVTKVTFNIGETSLQKAYYSIPDLKSAQMTLGLSVDLSWKDGFTYEITF